MLGKSTVKDWETKSNQCLLSIEEEDLDSELIEMYWLQKMTATIFNKIFLMLANLVTDWIYYKKKYQR